MVAKNRKKFNLNKKNILKWFYIFLSTTIFIILLISCFNIFQKRIDNEKELEAVNQELDNLIKQRDLLNFTLGETYSEEYLERVAREDLNMQKPGEIVYIIKKESSEMVNEEEKEYNFFEKIINWIQGLPE
ncbi:MAG: septum formation initiator family protein [Candidatus Pacebacteria bacterium]|nr:septum formation initiator family protein [Candidatus Paceibacterota bacterium]MDD4074357.1 septum formation initiator family protein [Candidatus Paceibacterota bacterium]